MKIIKINGVEVKVNLLNSINPKKFPKEFWSKTNYPKGVLLKTEKAKSIIKIDWEVLQKIAEYYEFPTVVFLMNKKEIKKMLKRTRRVKVKEQIEQLEKIKKEIG